MDKSYFKDILRWDKYEYKSFQRHYYFGNIKQARLKYEISLLILFSHSIAIRLTN